MWRSFKIIWSDYVDNLKTYKVIAVRHPFMRHVKHKWFNSKGLRGTEGWNVIKNRIQKIDKIGKAYKIEKVKKFLPTG